MAENGHAFWNPSGIESVIACAGKKALEQGRPDTTNEHAASGTASHQVLTWALQRGKDASDWVGVTINLDVNGRVIQAMDLTTTAAYSFKVDDERADRIQVCIDYVRNLMALDPQAVIFIDKKVSHAARIGVPADQGTGTLDVAVLLPTLRKLYGIDYKDGRGYVSAGSVIDGPNGQVACYMGGLVDLLSIAHDFDDYELVLAIVQPRCSQVPQEHSMTLPELDAWFDDVAKPAILRSRLAVDTYRPKGDAVAQLEWEETFLKPGDSQCQYCRAKAPCPANRDDVTETVFGAPMATAEDFGAAEVVPIDPTLWADQGAYAKWVGFCLTKVDQIEDWCKAQRTEAERLMLAGIDVPGHELVQGKQGNRSWTDEAEAAAYLKTVLRADALVYDFKLISPTSAEKLAGINPKTGEPKKLKPGEEKPPIGPRQWPKLKELIQRKPGRPHVAPIGTGREPVRLPTAADDFDVIEGAVTEVQITGGALGGGMSDFGQEVRRDASDFA